MKLFLRLIFSCTIIVVIFLISLLLKSTSISIAQTSISITPSPVSIIPSPTSIVTPPTPNIEPTIVSLQNMISTQQIEIKSLRLDLDYEARNFKWWISIAGVIAAGLGITNYSAYRGIGTIVRKKIRALTNRYYYQLDVTNLDVHIREGEHLDRLIDILNNQGLYNISRFNRLNSKSFHGITIFSIENAQDEADFKSYIERYFVDLKQLNSNKAGFILYAPTAYRIDPKTTEMYSTTALANTPWNLVSTLMVLGRHITAPLKIEDEDEE